MAYVTRREAVLASRSRYRTAANAEMHICASADIAEDQRFDIFLSHSSEDAEIIAGVKLLLEMEELSVYVDWIQDSQLDRRRGTAGTANPLRTRMNHCGYLLYASSTTSSSSRWMPWELGYFDGRRPGCVGVLPVVSDAKAGFEGIEYLGLYPIIERIPTDVGLRLGKITSQGYMTGQHYMMDLATMARG